MRIEYTGVNPDGCAYERTHRTATIWYDDDSNKECYVAKLVIAYLSKVCGYKVCSDCGFIGVDVRDREEFTEVKEAYKEIKCSALKWYKWKNRSY